MIPAIIDGATAQRSSGQIKLAVTAINKLSNSYPVVKCNFETLTGFTPHRGASECV